MGTSQPWNSRRCLRMTSYNSQRNFNNRSKPKLHHFRLYSSGARFFKSLTQVQKAAGNDGTKDFRLQNFQPTYRRTASFLDIPQQKTYHQEFAQRGRGGTGRRAGLRSLLPQGSGSSILLVRTNFYRVFTQFEHSHFKSNSAEAAHLVAHSIPKFTTF